MHNKINWQKVLKYLFPSLVTLLVMAIIFKIQNLYPFGTQALVQVDADYIYIPVLYKIYDLLHYGGNIFYSSIGLGSSIYGPLIIQGSLFSPLNLLLYLTSRDNIINFFSIFLIIKMCLISFTSYIYINHKYFKIKYFYKVLFSILYTFSGFVLLNYSNEIWLDFVILFPLLVMYLDKLLDDGKELGYIIVLSISLIISAYFSIFLVVFILFYSCVNLYVLKKKNIKSTIFKLGKSTLIAFLISSFSSIPLVYQILNSDRFGWASSVSLFNNIHMKSLYILFCPLLVIIFISLLFKYRKDKRNVLKYFLLMLLYLLPLILDPINTLMHGGSYWSFPYRYGFIPIFILMDASLYYVSNYSKDKQEKADVLSIITFLGIMILGVIGILIHNNYVNLITETHILLYVNSDVYVMIIRIVIIIFAMYILSIFIRNKYIRLISLSLVSLYSILSFSTFLIYHRSSYWLCQDAQNTYSKITLPKDGIYKTDYITHTPYYGYIFDVSTLDNWLHIIPADAKDTYKKMGYYTTDTKIYSAGGTIFTDWLLNFKYVLSNNEINNDMFTLIDNSTNRYLYKYNYNENYGLIINKFDFNSSSDLINRFDYQNDMYHKLFDTMDNIIDYHNYDITGSSVVEIKYNIHEDGYLYFYSNMYNMIDYITVDDETYTDFEDNIRNLGRRNHSVNIKVYLANGLDNTNFDVGFIKNSDINKLKSSVIYKDNKYYVDTNDDDKYLFLPINNIKGLHVYNKEEEIEKTKCLDNFVCIKLKKGENEIKIEYEQPLFKLGIILSFIGLILLVFHKKIKEKKWLLFISFWLYNAIIEFIFIYYYILSFFKYLN